MVLKNKPGATKINLGEAFRVLNNRNYRLLWISQVGGSASQWVETIARSWLIWELTGSATLLAAVNLLRAVPMLVFGLFAGVAADRFDKRNILIICKIFTLINYLVIATVIVMGLVEVWHVLLSAFVMGCSHAFEQPARNALIPGLVKSGELTNAIALNSAAMNMTRAIGPAIAGLMIAPIGIGGVYYASAGVYVITLTATIMLQVPPILVRQEQTSMWKDLVEAFRYVYKEKDILVLILLALIPMIFGQPYMTLMPIFADNVLHSGASGFGLLQSASGIGGVLVIVFIAFMGRMRSKGLLAIIGTFGFGAFLIMFSHSTSFALSMVLMVFIGFASNFPRVLINTSLLEIAPREMHGRVMAIYTLDQGLMPLGTMTVGPFADIIGAPITVFFMGSVCALLAISLGIGVPKARRIQ